MASDSVVQLAESLAKTVVDEGELSYKGQGRKLDDAQSVEDMVTEIQNFKVLQALRLEGNTIGVNAAQSIAKALETKSELKCCHWSDMFTGRLRSEIPPALSALGNALMMAGARLTVLDLSDNAFGPDGVKGIEMLLKSSSCYTLQELRLNNCGMGIGGGKVLASSLIECHKNSGAKGPPLRLKVFIAGRNRLENDGATALAQAFQLMGSLEEIHMPQNGINHPGVTALAEAIKHNSGLRVLNLNDNTFTEEGAIGMAQALRQLSCIQVLNFGDCLVRPRGALALANTMSEGLPNLRELNLSFGEITEEAALAVAHAVRQKDHLEKLDLNGNYLGEEGCSKLRELMEGNNMGDLLGSLSDDEGDPEYEDDEEADNDEYDDDVDDEEVEEEENEEEDFANSFTSPQPALPTQDVSSFLNFPSPDKLLRLGTQGPSLIERQVDVADAGKTAEAFLKISSVYKEENNEVKDAVLEIIDALLRKAFAAPSFKGYGFVSSLLTLLGLIKSEDKVKPVVLVPGHLQALEHVIQQDYFPKDNIAVLDAFMCRNSRVLESCDNTKNRLQSTLQRVRSEI